MKPESPIELEFISASTPYAFTQKLVTFTSYQFERSIVSPATAFRFTAPGVSKDVRTGIRSGDIVQIFGYNDDGTRLPIAMGIVDETDTHVTPSSVEYNVTGRDMLGQLVDNASVDTNNTVRYLQKATIQTIVAAMLENTRCPQGFTYSDVPNGPVLFASNCGETKINALQRVLEYLNVLLWTDENGQIVVGKPDFAQPTSGNLISKYGDTENNIIECRVRRNTNQAIRQIATQLQTLQNTSPTLITMTNQDVDMQAVAKNKVGRSVYEFFDYGNGGDTINLITQVGNQSGNYNTIGHELSRRKLARENMKILEVEAVVRGHTNSFGALYDIDQTYTVQIDDDNVDETMYCHSVSYELTKDQGMLTRLHLVRLNTIVSGAAAR